jgi:hypothetical protein
MRVAFLVNKFSFVLILIKLAIDTDKNSFTPCVNNIIETK